MTPPTAPSSRMTSPQLVFAASSTLARRAHENGFLFPNSSLSISVFTPTPADVFQLPPPALSSSVFTPTPADVFQLPPPALSISVSTPTPASLFQLPPPALSPIVNDAAPELPRPPLLGNTHKCIETFCLSLLKHILKFLSDLKNNPWQ